MNHEAQPEMTVQVTGEALLNPEQAQARSAIIEYYWDLTLARARKPDDPGLSKEDANRVRSILSRSADELQARANILWSTWKGVRGNSNVEDLFTKEALDGLVLQVVRVQTPFQTAEEINAAFREVLDTENATA